MTEVAGERIAKVLARHGVASRREAERMIAAGRVAVNGKSIESPALNVRETDRITVDGKALGNREPTRVWLYNKPRGLVTSTRDEKRTAKRSSTACPTRFPASCRSGASTLIPKDCCS